MRPRCARLPRSHPQVVPQMRPAARQAVTPLVSEARRHRHLDEVCITIHKERHSLWRAVDQAGIGLDRLVQSRRMQHAAKRFFRKLLKALTYVPRVIMTDTLNRPTLSTSAPSSFRARIPP